MEFYLTAGALVVELGVPVLLIYLSLKRPSKKHILLTMLGAVTPLLLFYLFGAIDYFVLNPDESSMYMAAFIMTFAVYCFLLLVGFLLGVFLPASISSNWRYFIGCILGPVCGIGLSILW
jgi:purine-cytosine permease-like protein